MSRPYLAALRPSGTHKPRTRQQRPRQSVSTQASKPGQGADAATLSHHPQASAHKQARKHPHEHAPRVNTKLSHPPSKHAHNRCCPTRANTKRPRHSAWASKMCERGNPWQQRATGTNEAQTTKAGTQTAHTRSAQTMGFAPCAPAPARGDSAREGRSQ